MRKRILVVDDDADVRESLELVLSDHFDVATAIDGQDALDKLNAEPFDAIVLDLMMPNVDGETVIQRLEGENKAIPIIMASAVPDLRERAKRAGKKYIQKPYDLDLLEAMLRDMTEGGAPPSGASSGQPEHNGNGSQSGASTTPCASSIRMQPCVGLYDSKELFTVDRFAQVGVEPGL